MHLSRFVLLLAALLLASLTSFAQAPAEPADEYFRAYLLNNEAERLASTGDLQRALDKYQQAQVIFDGIAQNTPTWQSDMLKFRRQRLADALTDVQTKITSGVRAPAPGTLAAPAPGPLVPTAPVAPPPQVPASPTPQGAPVPSSGDPMKDAINQLYRALDQRTSAVSEDLSKALQAVGEKAIQLDQANKLKEEAIKQRDKWYTDWATEKQQVEKLDQQYKELQKKGTSKADLDKARKELADAKEQLQDKAENQKKLESAITSLTTRLSESDMKFAAMQKERDDWKTRAMPDNMKQLLEEKQKLETQLADAQKQIRTLKEDATKKDAEIINLKGQLVKVQGELDTMRRENTALETQVADLTLELKKITERSIDPTKAKPDELPKLMAENQLLKGIVVRQIRQQARMSEQKRLHIEEINKSTNNSKTLIDQVEQLFGQRATLSDDEKKLFSTPQLEAMTDLADLKGTFIANSDPTTKNDKVKDQPPTKPDATAIDELMEKGNKLLADGKPAEAAVAYQDVLRAEPKNPTGLGGLAWSRVQQNKLDDAEATLRKAIGFNDKNDSAYYMLGVTLFRRDKSQDAIAAFEKSLSIKPENARARHYLGVITSKLGLTPRAEKEFKTALSIDSGYGEADFNLAVLYATSEPPKWELAKKHYAEALKKGVKPDTNLEKLLNGK